jgi:sec-independent protein translocase protein TatB
MPAGLTSPVHLVVIMFVALIVLGPEKLPEALRQVGRTIGEVRRWSDTLSSEMRGALSLDTGDDGATDPLPTAAVPAAPSPSGNSPSALDAPEAPAVAKPVSVAAGHSAEDPQLPHPALQEGGEWH